jgi:predicted RNase H-related nuclease YkuK (DUF458 family)
MNINPPITEGFLLKIKIMEKSRTWSRYQNGKIKIPITDYLIEIFEKEIALGNELKVCIGTDSQRHGGSTKFSTVVLILVKGKGGMIVHTSESRKNFHSIKEKMIAEVSITMEIAQEICWVLDMYDVDMEIHADINSNPEWPSNVALSEAMGWVKAMGYTFRCKDGLGGAFVASHCADRVCKNK